MTPFNVKITSYTHQKTKRTQWRIRSAHLAKLNDGGSPNERTFHTREEAVTMHDRIKELADAQRSKLAAYSDIANGAKQVTWADLPIEDQGEHADNEQDCAALADVPLIDPLLNALDDAHKFISDETVDGDVAKLRVYTLAYAQICETLAFLVGSSRTP